MSVRIDLSELGEGQYVEIKDPKFMTWKQQKAISSLIKENDTESQLNATEMLALNIIKGGYILDENGNSFGFPLSADSIENLPSIVIEEVMNKYADLKGLKPGSDERKNS